MHTSPTFLMHSHIGVYYEAAAVIISLSLLGQIRELKARPRTSAAIKPTLAKAEVGIAMGTGTDVAINSARITLVEGGLRANSRARTLSADTVSNIWQNLGIAFIHNAPGIPLAAGALYPLTGQLLSPMIAARAMSPNSVSIISNALRPRGAEK